MTAKLFVVIILIVLLSTGSMLFLKLPTFKLPEFSLKLPNLNDLFQSNIATGSSQLIYKPTPPSSPSKTPMPSKSPAPLKPVKNSQPKACYRYLITHLDGSTSNLCYSQVDYNQLVELGYQLSSTQTFYQFHLDGVARYQAEYDKTKSSIYLDAKASQQSKADQEKAKIDQITIQMYNLEAKGY